MVEMVKEVATGVVGKGRALLQEPSLVGEDFAFFAQKVPAVMWNLGAWNRSKYKVPICHHDPRFDMDEACMPLGVEMMTDFALEYLFRNS